MLRLVIVLDFWAFNTVESDGSGDKEVTGVFVGEDTISIEKECALNRTRGGEKFWKPGVDDGGGDFLSSTSSRGKSCGHSVHYYKIELGSFIDSSSNVEDVVESFRRVLYLGGYEDRSSSGCLDYSGAAAE
nr:hypothetical protein Iba_chr07bCG8990 [Ipomoea batatas]